VPGHRVQDNGLSLDLLLEEVNNKLELLTFLWMESKAEGREVSVICIIFKKKKLLSYADLAVVCGENPER
jgi:hypothetical protein